MLAMIRDLADRVHRLDKTVRGIKSRQVSQKAIKQEARGIVDSYFREARERILIGGLPIDHLSDLDAKMQLLLGVAQKNSTVQTFRTLIKKIDLSLMTTERLSLTQNSSSFRSSFDPTDRLIIDTLTNLLPSAARSYEQAIRDLQRRDRLSWRGPATDLRESLRETLDHLAPDADVMKEPGFKLERDASLPTMKQKVRFILRKRGLAKTAMQSPETATQAVDEIVSTFVRNVYSRSSVSTHTPSDRNEILRIRDWVRIGLCELLEIRIGA